LDGMEAKLDSILEMLKSQYVIYFWWHCSHQLFMT
jgi:hypothetical protein